MFSTGGSCRRVFSLPREAAGWLADCRSAGTGSIPVRGAAVFDISMRVWLIGRAPERHSGSRGFDSLHPLRDECRGEYIGCRWFEPNPDACDPLVESPSGRAPLHSPRRLAHFPWDRCSIGRALRWLRRTCGFESRRFHLTECSLAVEALGWGPRSRRFDSAHSDCADDGDHARMVKWQPHLVENQTPSWLGGSTPPPCTHPGFRAVRLTSASA